MRSRRRRSIGRIDGEIFHVGEMGVVEMLTRGYKWEKTKTPHGKPHHLRLGGYRHAGVVMKLEGINEDMRNWEYGFARKGNGLNWSLGS